MGVRNVGPPKISSSRQVEEENPQGRADDRKYLVCRKAHKILRAGGARKVEKRRPHSGGVRQPSSRRKRQCGFINTKNPGFVVSHKPRSDFCTPTRVDRKIMVVEVAWSPVPLAASSGAKEEELWPTEDVERKQSPPAVGCKCRWTPDTAPFIINGV